MHAYSSKRRSKSSDMFYKLGVLKDFAKFSFTGKHLCRSPLIKFKAWRPTSLKQRPRHKCFSVNFCKFFKNTYFVENVLTTTTENGSIKSNNTGRSLSKI